MKVFVSYSKASRDLVDVLTKDLSALGHSIWLDRDLTGGQPWWDHILSRIRDCDLFVFGITKDALDSAACRLEGDYAAKLDKPILPVLLSDDVPLGTLPPMLSLIQYVDYCRPDRHAAFALARALGSLPPPRPLPDPLPTLPLAPVSYLSNLRHQIESASVLTFEEQTAIVFRLKDGWHVAEDTNDVRVLLGRLRRRDDLLAKVAVEIDEILRSTPDRSQGGASSASSSSSIAGRHEDEPFASRARRQARMTEAAIVFSPEVPLRVDSTEHPWARRLGERCGIAMRRPVIRGLVRWTWRILVSVTLMALIALGLSLTVSSMTLGDRGVGIFGLCLLGIAVYLMLLIQKRLLTRR